MALFGLLALSSPRQALPEPHHDAPRTPTIGRRSMLLLSAILGFYLCALQLLGVQYRWLIVDATAYVEGPMMFVIANRRKVNAGYEDMFEELFRHQAHLVEGMPGFFKWELHRPLGDGWYVSITYWESRQHHDA